MTDIPKSKRVLLNTIMKRKLQCFGNAMRRDSFQRFLLDGKLNGERPRERTKRMRMKYIEEWSNNSYRDCARCVQGRDYWGAMMARPDGTT